MVRKTTNKLRLLNWLGRIIEISPKLLWMMVEKVTVSWYQWCQISMIELKVVFSYIGIGKNLNPVWQGSKYTSEVERISMKTKILLRKHFQ